MEDIIRKKTNNFIRGFRKQCEEQGMVFTEQHEDCMRIGISYGISLAAIVLSRVSSDAVIEKDDKLTSHPISKYTS